VAAFRAVRAERNRLTSVSNAILFTGDVDSLQAAIEATAPADLRQIDVMFRNLLARRRALPGDDPELIPAVEQRLRALYHWRTRSPGRRPSYLSGRPGPYLPDERLARLVNTESADEFATEAALTRPDADEMLSALADALAADLDFQLAYRVARRRRILAAVRRTGLVDALEFGDDMDSNRDFLTAVFDFDERLAAHARTGDVALLDTVVSAIPALVEHRSWLSYVEEYRIPLLEACANAATRRYEIRMEPTDILLATRLNAQMLEELPVDDPRRAGYAANLGTSLRNRFKVSADLADLDDAVAVLEYAADLSGRRDPVVHLVCGSLAMALLDRYLVARDGADLDRARAAAELAVRGASRRDPEYPTYFYNLSLVLAARHDRDGDPADLRHARAMAARAVRTAPTGHPRRALFVDLAEALADEPAPTDATELTETREPVETRGPALCPTCGTASAALRHPGSIVTGVDNDVASLRDLLSEGREVRCEVCASVLPVRPTTIAVMVGPDEGQPRLALQVVARGTFALTKDEHRQLAVAAAYVGWYVQQASEASVVHSGIDVITEVVEDRDRVVLEVLTSLQRRQQTACDVADDPTGLPRRWRELTGAVFTAAEVLIDAEFRVPRRQLTEAELNAMQLTVWRELVAFWSVPSPDPTLLLDSDLGNYVRRQPSLQAVRDFCALQPPSGDHFAAYAHHAVRASVCAAARIPNVLADDWAVVYLLRESLPGLITVGRHWARTTIGIDSGRRAVTGLLAATVGRTNPIGDDPLDALRRATAELGFDGLADAVARSLIVPGWHGPVAELHAPIRRQRATTMPLESLFDWVTFMIGGADMSDPGADLRALTAAIRAEYADETGVDRFCAVWLAELLLAHDLPAEALDLLDDLPAGPATGSATPLRCADLRARALTALGRPLEAVTVITAAMRDTSPITDPAGYRAAVLTAADAYSTAGAADRALAVLEAARVTGSGALEDFDAQYRFGALLSENDRHSDALAALVRAENMALDAGARLLSRYAQAKLHLHLGAREQTLEILLTEPPPDQASPRWAQTVLLQALTWRNALTAGPAPVGAGPLLDALELALDEITEPMDARIEAAARRASLAEVRGSGAAEELYARADALRRGQGADRDAVELLELARAAYRRKDLAAAREHVAEIPAATAAWLGALDDPAAAAGRLRPFAARLGELASDAVGSQWQDLLTIGELQRDTLYRLRSAASGNLDAGGQRPADLSEEGLGRLAQPDGTLAVVEWLNMGLGRQGDGFAYTPILLCTMILPGIGVGGRIQTAGDLPVGLDRTVRRIRSRLSNWHAGRAGDPLDLPAWHEAAAWMRGILTTAEIGDAHVVFIEHPLFAGAPWHTAVADTWTASYASSWQEIHDLVTRPRVRSVDTVGVLAVPRFNEPAPILAAMRASIARTQELAAPAVLTTAAERNDHDWFRHLLIHADIVKILCHGFVSPDDQEVCLMVAHDGTLPMAGSVAATSHGRGHRLTWRDCRDIHNATATVFSAACSSATSFTTLAGDRLGLYPALRRGGVPALVAPSWDVQAAPTMEILDQAINTYVAGRPLAQAVRQASRDAATRELSPWIARSLAVEGDWR